MKSPLVPGTPIDLKRFKRWTDLFGSYRASITNVTIQSWLDQFDEADRDLAARILDSVEFFGQSEIQAAYRQALKSLTGWNVDPSKRIGRWRFAAMSSSAGESGDRMLHEFRLANKLDRKAFNTLFVHRSDLLNPSPTEDDTIVLLDDFSGTGDQICTAWTDPQTAFGELLAGVGTVYLVLVAASESARKRITDETELSVVPAHELTDSDNVFSDKCPHFSKSDRDRLVHYGRIANKKHPKGYGECGLIVVFQHRSPNNSIPILHENNDRWSAIFPRHS